MENGNGGSMNAEKLQEALRAFGAGGGSAPEGGDLVALARRMGLQSGAPPVDRDNVAPGSKQYVIVVIGDVETAWQIDHVAGVERPGDITPVPGTANWVLGVANLRGAITSVVDLRLFAGLPRTDLTQRSRVVVATVNGMVIGFLVDGVNEMIALPPEALQRDNIRASIPPWLSPYTEAIASFSGRRLVVIASERLLFADLLHHYRAE